MPDDAFRKPSRKEGLRVEELDGEAVVYDPPRTKATYLNETATAVWSLCDGTRTIDGIIDIFAAEFPEDPSEIAADVREVIAAFDEAGLLGA